MPYVQEVLAALQNRGFEGAGIAIAREKMLHVLARGGTVNEVLGKRTQTPKWSATAGIGHTRYATSGSTDELLAQPFMYEGSDEKWQDFAFAFNGNIANYPEARAAYEQQHGPLLKEVDTELLGQKMLRGIRASTHEHMHRLFLGVEEELDGAYNVAAVNAEGELFAYAQKMKTRPFVYGTHNEMVFVASEDSAIRNAKPKARIRDLKPGHVLRAAPGKPLLVEKLTEEQLALCFLEYVYLAERSTHIEGVGVYNARRRLGHELAKQDKDMMPTQLVVPVPESAKASAAGYAEARYLRQVDALLRDPNYGRSFMRRADRKKTAGQKQDIDPQLIRGRDIVLMEDSIVRLSTLDALVGRIRDESGVNKIHLRISAPPILGPCFYGMDFSTGTELFARKFFKHALPSGVLPPEVLADMARHIGVDSLKFNSVEAIARALRKNINKLCMACVRKVYPTPAGQKRADEEEQRISLLK